MKRIIVYILLLVMATVGVGLLSYSTMVFADTIGGVGSSEIGDYESPFPASSTIYQKMLYTGVKKCYEKESVSGYDLLDSIELGEFTGINSITRKDDFFRAPAIGNTNAYFKCEKALANNTANTFPSSNPPENKKAEILQSMSYHKKSNSENSKKYCYSFRYDVDAYDDKELTKYLDTFEQLFSNELCIKNVGTKDNPIYETSMTSVDGHDKVSKDGRTISYDHQNGGQLVWYHGFGQNKLTVTVDVDGVNEKYEPAFTNLTNHANESGSLATIMNTIASMLGRGKETVYMWSYIGEDLDWRGYYGSFKPSCDKYVPIEGNKGIICYKNDKQVPELSFYTEWGNTSDVYERTMPISIENNNVILRNVSNGAYIWRQTSISKENDVRFTDLEKYELYQYYLLNYYSTGNNTVECRESSTPSLGTEVRLWENDKQRYNKYCYVVLDKTKENVSVHGVDPDGYFGVSITRGDLIKALNEELNSLDSKTPPSTFVDMQDGSSVDDKPSITPSGTEIIDGGSTEPCWNSGIDSMAWVMCPVEKNLTNFANGAGQLIDRWLEVDSSLYKTYNEDGKTETPVRLAWGYVRTIANTAMIVFLGIIIVSQLTGYGIDNYGIKKMLPKLIIMAILINLSFLICQLVVDLSNIIGNGIQGLFYGIGNNIATPDDWQVVRVNFIEHVTRAIYVAVQAGGAAVAIASVVQASGGSVLAVILIILMLLVVVIAILLFFVSLGARMVIILLCIILSPMAFACYVLPNTKSMYKKWFDAFKAAVIIYPICGFVIGLSYIIKAIVITQESPLWMIVVSGIAPYLPFFMIPTMLKSAISALGTVGAALTSMGSSFRNGFKRVSDGAGNMIKDSNAYKAAQAEGLRRRQANYSTRLRNRLDKKAVKKGGLENLTPREQRMRAYAQQTLDKQNAEDVAAMQSSLMADNKYSKVSDLNEAMQTDLQKALENYDKELANNGGNTNASSVIAAKKKINALSNMLASRGPSAAGNIAKAIKDANGEKGASKAALGVLRDNMAANKDFSNIMKMKQGAMFDKINSLGENTMLDSLKGGSLSSGNDWITQSGSVMKDALEEVKKSNDTVATEALRNVVDSVMNSSDPEVMKRIMSDVDKKRAWVAAAEHFGISYPGSSSSGAAQEGETFEIRNQQGTNSNVNRFGSGDGTNSTYT